MIQAHVTDAWTAPGERTTEAFRYLTVLGGFAAPLFLWLAGLSLVLAGDSIVERTGNVRYAWRRLVQRGLEIYVLAFLFRASAFLLNPGGPFLTVFRVDILNVMGPALVVVGVMWGLVRSPGFQLALLAVTATSVAMLTPVIQAATWVDQLPIWLQWHLRPSGEQTVFTFLPWTGFVFAGAATGRALALIRRRLPSRASYDGPELMLSLGLAGLAVLAIGLVAGSQPSIYRLSDYWTSSPAFFAVRCGIVLLTLSAAAGTARGLVRRAVVLGPLRRLGRASLLVYWLHVHLAYGWITSSLHKQLSLKELAVAYVLFCGAMYLTIAIRDRLRLVWNVQRRLRSDGPQAASA